MTNELDYSDVELAAPWAKNDLIDFAIVTDPSYDPNWHHEIISTKLQQVENGEIKRLIVSMPPRHGKSELCSIKFPAWYLGRHPDRFIIQSSYAAELAQDFGAKVRDLVSDPVFGQVFADTRVKQDSRDKGNWRTTKGGSYFAAGVGGPITGRGAHLFIIDDPVKNREEAESETMREKNWDWYTSTARTRLEKDAAIIIVMTRWHPDDLVGRLLEDQPEKWDLLELPAIAETNEEQRKVGAALWPEKYNEADLKEVQEEIGPRDWLALYQQHPVSSLTQEFKEEWFRYFEEDAIKNKVLKVWITIDPAISEEEKACNSALVAVGKEEGSDAWFILEVSADKMDVDNLLTEMFRMARFYGSDTKRYQLQTVGIEDVLFQKVLIYSLREKMVKENFHFEVVGLSATRKKEERIRGLLPYYKRGAIFHRRTQKELEEELIAFPTGKLKDRIDALAYQPQIQDGHEDSLEKERQPGSSRMEKLMKRRIKDAKHRAVI